MAPALSHTPREPHEQAIDLEANQQLTHRRRALAPVDNFDTSMEEDDMGLQNQPSLAKDSQEMEQILVDLGNRDLVQADLLHAIKTLEGAGDALSTGDPDPIFPLSGFDLNEVADSEGDSAEDKIKSVQARLDRRCAFLQRRLRILQARAIGKRVSEEATQVFEKCTRAARKDGGGRPMGLKALLKKIETTSALQASAASRTVVGPKYYHAGSSKGDASRSASIGIASGTLNGLQDTAGALRSHLSVVKHELDSDATASSSGAESNDEAITYNNPHQQHMPIEKRALWSYQRARASIASRWSWLQAQIQELEYKIRQHSDLHKQVREAKGPVELEGEPVAYVGLLPGEAPPEPEGAASETCARVRPLKRETFKKRKLLQMHNLHIATNKAAKPADARCSCVWGVSCAVCTGRAEPTQPAVAAPAASARVAVVDPGYHPVLSDANDISPSTHVSALLSRPWFLSRCNSARWRPPGRPPREKDRHGDGREPERDRHTPSAPERKAKRHPTRLKRGRPPLSRRVREREREPRADHDDATAHAHAHTAPTHERRRSRPSVESRCRRQSYDIDNIVIPQSVAANTRPQILTYKEIITPKWRIMDIPEGPLNNGVAKAAHRDSIEESDWAPQQDEDVSEAAVSLRHSRAEIRERQRYTRPRRRQEASLVPLEPPVELPVEPPVVPPVELPLVPPPMLPPPAVPASQPPTSPINNEMVRPYSPRRFPLRDDTYMSMVSAMPDGYRLSSPERSPPRIEEEEENDIDNSSTLSPLSPTPYDGDDPDDIEWDPSSEKMERRKSAFR